MAGTYAQGTEVSADRSRAEIEKALARYGAQQFMYGWDEGRGIVAFKMRERQIKFILPMPDRKERRFTHTEGRGQARTVQAAEKAYEAEVRRSWRALNLVVKAKLEAVASGIVTFEEEFGMHMVLPDGSTMSEHAIPAIEKAYATGRMTPLLPHGLPRAITQGD